MKIKAFGCSHTQHSGFLPENQHKIYHSVLAKILNTEVDNFGESGASNQLIASNVLKNFDDREKDDLFIIQWSHMHRMFFRTLDTPEGYKVYFNSGTTENLKSKHDLDFHKIYYSMYSNNCLEFSNTLNYMIWTQSLLKLHNIKYCFVLADPMYFHDLINTNIEDLYADLSDNLKNLYGFHSSTDDEVTELLNQHKKLLNQLDLANCVDFENFSFHKARIDLADDGLHYGIKSNKIFADKILQHLQDRDLV